MRDPVEIVKEEVRRLTPYSLVSERARIKLNQNENPWDAPLEIKDETLKRLRDRLWSRYPGLVTRGLQERLAQFSGWKPEGIIAGNGSNELIQAVLMVTLGAGRRVLISEPTFTLYRQISTVLGSEVVSVNLTPQLTYDLEALRKSIETIQPSVTIICSPNNPTGCVMEHPDLVSLLEATRGLVVVDEAYFEFSGQSVVPLLEKHSNLVVLRTFSKAMAMAALRIGYLLASPELVREIAKAVLPYNLNIVSQTASEVAMELYDPGLAGLVQLICRERERIFAELKRLPGLAPVRSRANFILIRSELPLRQVFDDLLQRGILVRDVSSYPMLQNCFRISVGTPEENDALLEALGRIFKISD
jgi:histidinol-phosphate aminotransferase